jgi:hypothetical protein
VPLVYGWWDLTAGGAVVTAPGEGNGRRGGDGARLIEGESA